MKRTLLTLFASLFTTFAFADTVTNANSQNYIGSSASVGAQGRYATVIVIGNFSNSSVYVLRPKSLAGTEIKPFTMFRILEESRTEPTNLLLSTTFSESTWFYNAYVKPIALVGVYSNSSTHQPYVPYEPTLKLLNK